MTGRNIDQRLNQMHWQPSAIPSQQVVDDVLRGYPSEQLRGEWIAAGLVLGVLIGFGIKGTTVTGGPFGPHADTFGYIFGAFCLLAGAASVSLTAISVSLHKRVPHLMRFSLFNMLMIMVILIS